MAAPTLTFTGDSQTPSLRLSGRLVSDALGAVEKAVNDVRAAPGAFEIDLSGLEALDTSGAWIILDLKARLEADGAQVKLVGTSPVQDALLQTVSEAIPTEDVPEDASKGLTAWIESVGARSVKAGKGFASLLSFLGITLHRLFGLLIRPWRLRGASLFSHMQDAGLNAVPIVTLMSFLIGIVLAFQGAAQLRQFGAEVFVVDLIAVSMLRELGILMTAIIVAGRSGSSFTASVGSMKVREEIDAMRTLGLDPIEVLVVPRVLALLIMLPVLGFLANIAGLIGGALMSWIELGVSPGMFITRLNESTDVWQLAVGLIKAPVFGLIVALAGCFHGMQVKGNSEEVGLRTTMAVVSAIFAVIVLDAFFAVFFTEVGWG